MAYYNWLGKKEELEYAERRFEGKLGAKSWKYSQQIDKLAQIRFFIFLMSILVFFPVLTTYLAQGYHFPMELFVERLIFSVVLVIGGLLFNKYRIAAILIASLPLILIQIAYVMNGSAAVFNAAFLIFILSGLYFQFQAKKLRKELDRSLLENQLIDDE